MASGGNQTSRGPALLCYDGSDAARGAIERAGAVLAGGSALVLTVWESLGSALLRAPFPKRAELGRDVREISEDVVDALDAGTADWARATAAEGVEIAMASGFEARALPRRALGRMAERAEVTIWQAVLEVAEEEDVAVLVLGSTGRSGLTSTLVGSVSHGIVHHSTRPLLIVPPAPRG